MHKFNGIGLGAFSITYLAMKCVPLPPFLKHEMCTLIAIPQAEQHATLLETSSHQIANNSQLSNEVFISLTFSLIYVPSFLAVLLSLHSWSTFLACVLTCVLSWILFKIC